VKKLFSIFLLVTVALSSVGMSVSQHFCTMSKEEIEANACDMCSSKDHGEKEGSVGTEKSCCSNEAVHLKLDTDATGTRSVDAPQPLFTALPLILVLTSEEAPRASVSDRSASPNLAAFPLAEKHTVLRV
jgi:hypothetical protein